MFLFYRVIALFLGLAVFSSVHADQVTLKDGSRLNGTITQISENTLKLDTEFAGPLEIELDRVDGITTASKRFIELDSGDRISGTLELAEDGRQRLTNTAFGDIDLDTRRISALWSTDSERPVLEKVKREHEQEIAALEQSREQQVTTLQSDYEAELQQMQERTAKLEDPWSGNIAFGLLGASGNTERFGIQGRGELFRETSFDRLALYMEGTFQEEGGNQTANEVLAGALLERDISDRWFAYGSADFEIDEFENLDLRALVTTGLGYFFVREQNFEFKGRAGLGYQFESFSDGTTSEEPIGLVGYDLRYDYNSWLRFLHDLTYYPAFTDPAADYRVVTNFAGEMPLGGGDWSLRAGIRNQYDAMPAVGVKNTDTTYQFNVVYDWE